MSSDETNDCVQRNSDRNLLKDSSDSAQRDSIALTKNRYLAGEQISQEENCLSDDAATSMNGFICSDSSNERNTQTKPFKSFFNQNNNLIVDQENLRCTDEKSHCYVLKFPLKVNNNIYPEKSMHGKDGMDDYFKQYSVSKDSSNRLCNDFTEEKCLSAENISETFHDQINSLNGDDEDEDNGCIYTYKGDDYESNLSHLLETCFCCGLPTTEPLNGPTQRGPVSIQRLLNGSPNPPNPQANLFSPEMDFLEMDFDPADEGGDSDCEDNSDLIVDQGMQNTENTLENFIKEKYNGVVDKKSNVSTEFRSFMCKRCELYEKKVKNTSTNSIQEKSNCDSSMQPNSAPSIDKQCSVSSESAPEKVNQSLSINASCSQVSNREATDHSSSLFPVTFSQEINNLPSNSVTNTYENNLNAGESIPNGEFSDGDDADDEGAGDEDLTPDSTLGEDLLNFPETLNRSEKAHRHIRFSFDDGIGNTLCNGLETNNSCDDTHVVLNEHEASVCSSSTYPKSNSQNNNLGSISAPEVSPIKEYSPLEKFSRSTSFHNQLSSPKYENVCFSHPYKDNLLNHRNHTNDEQCFCMNDYSYSKRFHPSADASNLEACVDRLNQRERSVFNISKSANYHSLDASAKVSNSKSRTSEENDLENPREGNSRMWLPLNPSTTDSNNALGCEEDYYDDIEKLELEVLSITKVMIWTEKQAIFRQVTQVGTSACGATAIINVLLALDEPRPVKDVTVAIRTRLRAENSPLVDYLLSRGHAGTNHEDLLKGIQEISKGAVMGRFFHMFPKRAFQLTRWLATWIQKGGVPVATLNLQVGVPPGQTVPDAWHHQMVFGVGPMGIYLTNPLECVTDSLLSDQLCSDSILLIRRADIETRWTKEDQLIRLSLQPDSRWNEMNVLGQVVSILKEEIAPEMLQGRRHLTSHVSIPAFYQSGITIFMRSDNPNKKELLEAKELPLLDE